MVRSQDVPQGSLLLSYQSPYLPWCHLFEEDAQRAYQPRDLVPFQVLASKPAAWKGGEKELDDSTLASPRFPWLVWETWACSDAPRRRPSPLPTPTLLCLVPTHSADTQTS